MAIRINYLFPECYVDTNILKTLFHLDGVNHQSKATPKWKGVDADIWVNEFRGETVG